MGVGSPVFLTNTFHVSVEFSLVGGPWRATTPGCKGWDAGRVLPVEDGQVDATGPGGKVRKHSRLPPHLPAKEGPLGKPPWLSDDNWRFRR